MLNSTATDKPTSCLGCNIAFVKELVCLFNIFDENKENQHCNLFVLKAYGFPFQWKGSAT